MKKFLMYCSLITLISCSVENDIYQSKGDSLRGELSGKSVLVKLSYVEETFRKAEFSNKDAVDFGLTYLEEPKSERKKIYIEIYKDMTFGKLVEFLPSNSDYPADKFIPHKDFSQLRKLIYSDGIVKGIDGAGEIVHTDTYDDQYMTDHKNNTNSGDLSKILLSSFNNPDSIADYFIKSMTEGNIFKEVNEKTIEITKQINLNSMIKTSLFEVAKEKIFLNKEKGVVTRVEGYTRADELKDLVVNMYGLTPDGIHYMKSSHFRNKQYSEAYNIFYLEYSDIFINDFKFQTSKQ
jgi:hypothetical protein